MLLILLRLESPCDDCAAPYGFHNQLNLTEDTARFRVSFTALRRRVIVVVVIFLCAVWCRLVS